MIEDEEIHQLEKWKEIMKFASMYFSLINVMNKFVLLKCNGIFRIMLLKR